MAKPRSRGYLPALPDTQITSPLDQLMQEFGLPDPPDPITFVMSPEFLNRPNLYPRQATFLKIIFLRDDLFTDYDYAVIEEWTDNFRGTGNNGTCPDILRRIEICKERGYKWFREVLAVLGRRAGKGHIGALAMAYILWNYLALGDPQAHYGIDRSKKLTALMFAGKRDQAKENLWRDLVNVIQEAPCFAPYVSRAQAESLTVYAPADRKRERLMAQRGIYSELDIATFAILPRESTLMAGRGVASFMQGYDEMAHVVATGANRSAEEVYGAATPSLDQFGKDGFIYEPSSPWQMMGQFYTNYENCLRLDPETGDPMFPTMMMLQLTSWDIYEDWDRAENIYVYPETWDQVAKKHVEGHSNTTTFKKMRGAIQSYDQQMIEIEKANPDTFKVERRSQFAAALDAYLNEVKIRQMFLPWEERMPEYGPPNLEMQERGVLVRTYKAHGDPSLSNANFGWAIAHAEPGPDGVLHCVFDKIHHWAPQDWDDGFVDYQDVMDDVWQDIIDFIPGEVTFDQWNSASDIQRLVKRTRDQQNLLRGKRVNIFEKTANATVNFNRNETFKTALNMGWVHAPYYEQAELELRFLQMVNGKVDKPSIGPVQTKDVADCVMECVQVLIGDQVNNFMQEGLSAFTPRAALEGGIDPFPQMRQGGGDERNLTGLSGFGRARGMRPEANGPGLGGFGRARGPVRTRRG